MVSFISNVIIWTLAIYGGIEIIKTVIYYAGTNKKESKGTYIVITTKDDEEYIEGFLRSVLFKIIYGREDYIKQILIVDLNSQDNTKKILDKLELDYGYIKVVDWNECKEIIENEI